MDVILTSAAIWARFVRSGGIRPQDYDADLVVALRRSLGLLDDGDFGRQLDDEAIAPERFIPALLSSLEPFAHMMSDLCEFFVRHGVRETGQGLRIAFDFETADDVRGFDLEHFRKWLSVWSAALESTLERSWNYSELWRLHRILWDAAEDAGVGQEPFGQEFRDWLGRERSYGPGEAWPIEVPHLPSPYGIEKAIIRAIDEVCAAVAAFRKRRVDLFRDHADAVEQGRRVGWEIDRSSAVPLSTWPIGAIAMMESDYFAAGTMQALWRWISALSSASGRNAAPTVARDILSVVDALPQAPGARSVPQEQLLSVLDLPIWNKRDQLYGSWLITLVETALRGIPCAVHHRDGALHIAFAETPVATFSLGSENVELVAEWKTPLDSPEGKSRKGAVQPDYVLRPAGQRDPSATYAVIEAKQYLAPKPGDFAKAINDYARGHVNATVILLDYGPMTTSVLDRVRPELLDRARAFGDVRPRQPAEIGLASRAIQDALPKTAAGIDIVVVDVSSSMAAALRSKTAMDAMRTLAVNAPLARWLAVDEQVVFEGTADDVIPALEGFVAGRGTRLSVAFANCSGRRCVAFTDEDGADQLEAVAGRPLERAPLGPDVYRVEFTVP